MKNELFNYFPCSIINAFSQYLHHFKFAMNKYQHITLINKLKRIVLSPQQLSYVNVHLYKQPLTIYQTQQDNYCLVVAAQLRCKTSDIY